MTNQTQGQSEASTEQRILIRVQESAFAVPVAVLERHRIPQQQHAQVGAELGEQLTAAGLPAEAPLYELSPEALAPYRLSSQEWDELETQATGGQASNDTAGFGRYAPNQPKGEPISGYTGYAYSVHFGGFVNAPGGRIFIGVFPMWQPEDTPSGPYPGLR